MYVAINNICGWNNSLNIIILANISQTTDLWPVSLDEEEPNNKYNYSDDESSSNTDNDTDNWTDKATYCDVRVAMFDTSESAQAVHLQLRRRFQGMGRCRPLNYDV